MGKRVGNRGGGRAGGGGLLAALALLAALPAAGTLTDPVLAVTAAEEVTAGARRLLAIDAVFPEADLVQLPLPLQILVRADGAAGSYVRFDLAAGAFEGAEPALADGVSPAEAVGLLGVGSPAPDAELLLVAPGRLEVLLPGSFPAGPAEVLLFVLHEGDPILSNPVPVAPDPGAGS